MRTIEIDCSKLLPHDKAFNCSIQKWRDRMLMAYRIEEHQGDSWAKLAICELGSDWQPIKETNRFLTIPRPAPHTNLFEDPRLYVEDGALMMSFIAATLHGGYGHVACQGKCYLHPETLEASGFHYPGIGNNHNHALLGYGKFDREKNWTFYEDKVIYSLNPLIVFQGEREIARSKANLPWHYGNLSGSTQLVPFAGKLLGMFHSFILKPDSHHDGGHRRHYFTGWYLIDPETWRLTAISKEPVITAQDGSGELRALNQQWRPNVVFPCGLVDLGGELALSYGWQDSTCRISIFSHEEVSQNLKPVTEHFVMKEALLDPYVTIPTGFACEVRGHKLHARSWPKLVRQAIPLGIEEQELHDQLVSRVRPEERKLVWAKV